MKQVALDTTESEISVMASTVKKGILRKFVVSSYSENCNSIPNLIVMGLNYVMGKWENGKWVMGDGK
jgi:hypothetical protein